jgi:hypothetical protein
MGLCFAGAYAATGTPLYRAAALAAGNAVACAQNADGGWQARAPSSCAAADAPRTSHSSLDEGMTAEPIEFLLALRVIEPTGPSAAAREAAIRNGLDFLLSAQKHSGGWPLRTSNKEYFGLATLNDRVTSSAIAILLRGWKELGDTRYREAALRGGDFLIAAQQAEGGWAQQYDDALKPAPARSFEPAALATRESAYAMLSLIELYRATGEARFLAPLARARAWLLDVRIAPERWARLHDLATGEPIYVDRDGSIHSQPSALSHERRLGYAWQGRFPEVVRALRYADAALGDGETLDAAMRDDAEDEKAMRISDAALGLRAILDDGADGLWTAADGRLYTRDFIENCEAIVTAIDAGGAAAQAP